MPEQDPIPPRRSARRRAPGEDEEVPPWADLPSVRPTRPDRRDQPSRVSQEPRPDQGLRPGQRPRPDQRPRYDAPPRGTFGGTGRGMPPNPGGPAGSPGPAGFPGGQYPSAGPGTVPAGPSTPPGGYAPPGYPGPAGYPGPTGTTAAGPGGPAATPGPYSPTGLPYSSDLAQPGEEDQSARGPDAAVPSRPRIGSRASQALSRKRRRVFILGGSTAAAIAVVLTVVFLTHGNTQAAVISDQLITTFQPGELAQVPDACEVIPAATVRQYLPGNPKRTAPLPINGKLESACNWTLDHQPTYRLLEVDMLAYAPNGMVPGNGSATNAAIEAYNTTLQGLRQPPKHSVNTGATVTTLSGIGNAAFSAAQTFHVGGATSEQATVVIRFHNVIVTVEFSGLEHSNKGHYGPVSKSELANAALAFAQSAYASLH